MKRIMVKPADPVSGAWLVVEDGFLLTMLKSRKKAVEFCQKLRGETCKKCKLNCV